MTTLGELRNTYSYVHRDFNYTAYKLAVQKRELEEKINNTPNGEELFGKQAAVVEIKYEAVQEKLEEYNSFIASYMETWNQIFEKTNAESNAEAMKDYYDNLQKIMTVAQRMSHGDKVPGSDEKKLMEFDNKLYMAAKNAQMLAQLKERKEYESLWEDDEKKEYADGMEVADNTETNLVGPEIFSAQEIMDAAVLDSASIDLTGES